MAASNSRHQTSSDVIIERHVSGWQELALMNWTTSQTILDRPVTELSGSRLAESIA